MKTGTQENGKRAREGSIEEPTACITSHLIGGDHSARRSAAAEKGRLDLIILTACCHPGNRHIAPSAAICQSHPLATLSVPLIRGSGEGRRILAIQWRSTSLA